MIAPPSRFESPILPRALGIVLGVAALGLVLQGVELIEHPHHRAPLDSPLGGAILLAVSAACLALAARLFDRRPRADGGYLSPTVLRIGGVVFIVAPFVFPWHAPHPELVVAPAAMFVTLGFGAFKLAKQREKRARESLEPR